VAQPSVDLRSLLAMAAGTPVIAAAGGCSDFLVADQTALLFAQSNGLELSQRLASLLDAPSRAHDIAAGALAALRARYTAAGMTAAVAELYRRVAEPSPQRVSG
jgi:glycosyltransferase involved in cell wall biosynthesis